MSRTRYPLDYAHELKPHEWSVEDMIHDARTAGWIVTRELVLAWIRSGMLPPPARK